MLISRMLMATAGELAMGIKIANIQRFYETMENEVSRDVTITEVDVDKTMLIHNGLLESGAGDDDSQITIKLLNSTTVRLEVQTTIGTPSVSFTVVEFSSGINNIQRGYTQMSEAFAQTLDVTITEVDLSKSFASHLGYKSSNTNFDSTESVIRLLNSTTLRLQKIHGPQYLSWEVIEFS